MTLIPPNDSFWRAVGIYIQSVGPDILPPPIPDAKPWFCIAGGRGQAAPPCNTKPMFCVKEILYVESCVVGTGGVAMASSPPAATQDHGFASGMREARDLALAHELPQKRVLTLV